MTIQRLLSSNSVDNPGKLAHPAGGGQTVVKKQLAPADMRRKVFHCRCKTSPSGFWPQLQAGESQIAVSQIKVPETRENGTQMRHSPKQTFPPVAGRVVIAAERFLTRVVRHTQAGNSPCVTRTMAADSDPYAGGYGSSFN